MQAELPNKDVGASHLLNPKSEWDIGNKKWLSFLIALYRRDAPLVAHAELPNEDFEVELSDVCFSNPNLDEILENEKWMDEAT